MSLDQFLQPVLRCQQALTCHLFKLTPEVTRIVAHTIAHSDIVKMVILRP